MSSSTPTDLSGVSKQSEDDNNDDTGSSTRTATIMGKSTGTGTGTGTDMSATASNDDDIDMEAVPSPPAPKKSKPTSDSNITNTTTTSSNSTNGTSSSTISSTASGASNDGKTPVLSIVDPEANINGTIISIDGCTDPCDCMLVRVDTASIIDTFFVLQLISPDDDGMMNNGNRTSNSPIFVVYKRWGSTFSVGQDDQEVYDEYTIAVRRFQTIFEELTGYTWNNRAGASGSTGTPIPNKYELIQQNMEEKKRGYDGAKWQYRAGSAHQPRWDDYDPFGSKYAEQLFHEYKCNPHLRKRLVRSDWYKYEIDFVLMTQTNVQHPERTSREILRCPILQEDRNNQQSISASLHSMSVSQAPSLPPRLNPTEFRTLPETLKYVATDDESNIVISKLIPTAPPIDANNKDCVICLSEMKASEDIVKFDVTDCSHVFHRHCIETSIRMSKPQCPTCRRPIREVRGFSPSGTMSIYTTREACNGHESSIGTIIIDYRLPTDIQRQYHPNPGKSFYGTMRTAYLPDNKEGKELLLRLKYAWTKGLCFTVGTSMTTGRSNVITWSSVHHKTSMYAGAHGYPDPQFFWNCNFELDGLGVPKAQDVQTSPHLLEPPPYRVEQSTSTSSSASMSTTSQVLPHSSNRRAQLSNSVAAAVASMTINGSTPSQLQLENGLSILNIIRNKINGADVSDGYEELSSRFYSTIPHSFGHQSPPVISTLSFLQERYDACIHLMNS